MIKSTDICDMPLRTRGSEQRMLIYAISTSSHSAPLRRSQQTMPSSAKSFDTSSVPSLTQRSTKAKQPPIPTLRTRSLLAQPSGHPSLLFPPTRAFPRRTKQEELMQAEVSNLWGLITVLHAQIRRTFPAYLTTFDHRPSIEELKYAIDQLRTQYNEPKLDKDWKYGFLLWLLLDRPSQRSISNIPQVSRQRRCRKGSRIPFRRFSKSIHHSTRRALPFLRAKLDNGEIPRIPPTGTRLQSTPVGVHHAC